MSGSTLDIRELNHEEMVEFLQSQNVGRIAYAFRGVVNIAPVHYVYDDGWLYGRTSMGPKLATLAHSHWVAFEVDDIRSPVDWTSVVIRGSFRPIDPDGSDEERGAAEHATQLLRKMYPDALTDADITPHRRIVFRIHIDEASGRTASLSTGG